MRFEDLDLDYVFSARHLHLSSYFLHRALRPRVPNCSGCKTAGLTIRSTPTTIRGLWGSDVLDANLNSSMSSGPTNNKLAARRLLTYKAAARKRSRGRSPLVIKRRRKGVLAEGTESFKVARPSRCR